jgi:hypothetical protein
VAALHAGLAKAHEAAMQEHCDTPALEDGEEEFPIRLGLRY